MDDRGNETLNTERELQNLRMNNAMLQDFSETIKKQMNELEEELQKSRHDYIEVLQSKYFIIWLMRYLILICLLFVNTIDRDAVKCDFDTLSNEATKLKNHKLELAEMLEKKNEEISRLKETINSIETFNRNNTHDSNLNSSLNDIKMKEIKLTFEENRLNHERDLFNKQIKQLTEDVQTKSNELLTLRKDNNVTIMQGNLKMEQQSNEINRLHIEINQLKGQNENKDKVNQDLSKNYLELQLQCNKLESTFSKETEAQNDVIQLLMKRTDDLQNDLTNKVNENNDLRDILKKGYEGHSALELEFESMKESYINDIKELETDRAKMKRELEHCKTQVSEFNKRCIEKEFEKHFPLAFENNRQLNNLVSLADIYDEFARTKQEKEELDEKNAKLVDEIHTLENRLNEDRPIMYKNFQSYKQMVSSYSTLEEQYLSLLSEKDIFVSQKDEDTRSINTLQREIRRYEIENNQLSIQIQNLLKSDHRAKGFSLQDSSMNLHSSDTLNIPLSMIAFSDIQDLQEKNRELIRLLNNLTAELDNGSSTKDESDRLAIIKNELDQHKREVEQLKDELNQKNELLERGNKQQSRLFSVEDCFDPKELVSNNKELKAKVEKYQQDIETCRQQNLEEVRRLDNSKNALFAENVNAKAEILSLTTDLESKRHHIDNISMTLEKYQNENASLRERNIKLNANVENLEKNIIYVKNEIDSLKETLKLSENSVHLAQYERDLYKNNETSLIKENAMIKDDLENHKRLVYSLRAIQDNYNKSESESVRSLQVQIENLRQNNEYYRIKLEKEEEKWRITSNDLSARINNLQVLLDKEKNNCIELQHKYFDLQMQHQKEVENAKAAAVNEAASTVGDSSTINSDQKRQLLNLQDEVKVLKGKLTNSEATCENMKSINLTLEENLNKLISNNEENSHNFTSELQNKSESIRKLLEELNTTREEYDLIVAQKNATIEQIKASADSNAQQIEELKNLFIIQQEATHKAQENEQNLADDLTYQRAIAAKALEDYEAEVALHSDDSATIFELKLQVESAQKNLLEKESEITKLKDQASLNMNLWENQRKSLFDDGEALKARCSSLESTNETLLSQIDQLNNQVIALQNNSNIFSLDEANQQENANQLLGVVKFIREEKAQLQSKFSKLNDDHVCLQIEVENYKKEIANLKNAIEIEKQSTNRVSNMTEFNNLLSKAELVPILTENNSQMRIEINQLEKRCSELLEKIAKYELNEESVNELANKAEDEVVEKQFLQSQVEQFKVKINALNQQLKSYDSDSIKRLLSEKTNLSRQVFINQY